RERLQAAKTRKKFDMARVLEEEIANLEKRQSELLGAIANSVVSEQGEAPGASPADSTGDSPIILTAPDPSKSGDAELSTQCDREETAVWTQLTPGDVEHARRELMRQRAETLARHAEELTSLDAENEEVAV